jgi:hypothetical protein
MLASSEIQEVQEVKLASCGLQEGKLASSELQEVKLASSWLQEGKHLVGYRK